MDTWVKQEAVKKIISHALIQAGVRPMEHGPYYLLKQYPVLCGLWIYSLQYRAQVAGLNSVNAWGSLTYCAHMYNAMRQKKLLKSAWTEMEDAMALHQTRRIFIGDIPNNPGDYLKRSSLCMGWSVTALAKNSRSPKVDNMKQSRSGPCSLLDELLALHKLFSGRYVNHEASLSTNLSAAANLIGFMANDSRSPKDAIDFLNDLASGFQGEALAMSFDYFAFFKTC